MILGQSGYKLSIKADVCEGKKFSTFELEIPHKALKVSVSSNLLSDVTSFCDIVDFSIVFVMCSVSILDDETLDVSVTCVL